MTELELLTAILNRLDLIYTLMLISVGSFVAGLVLHFFCKFLIQFF